MCGSAAHKLLLSQKLRGGAFVQGRTGSPVRGYCPYGPTSQLNPLMLYFTEKQYKFTQLLKYIFMYS